MATNLRMNRLKFTTNAGELRSVTFEGRETLVAPVVALTEGVHNGEFVSYAELSMFPESWDGIPLPIDHPNDANGNPITANSPSIIEKVVIGRLFNVQARDDIRGIAGELWIDVEKAQTINGGQEVLDKLNKNEQLEVSTGYFTVLDVNSGEWLSPKGKLEKFSASQKDIRPDHLALLPFGLGACSWEDGCGAPRINKDVHAVKSIPMADKKEALMAVLAGKDKRAEQIKAAKALKEEFNVVAVEMVANGSQMANVLKSALSLHASADGSITSIMERLAQASGTSAAKIAAIINGQVDFIPRTWLNIFAAVLDIDTIDLALASDNDNHSARWSINEKIVEPAAENVEIAEEDVSIAHNDSSSSDKPCGPCAKSLTEKVKEIIKQLGVKLGIDGDGDQNMNKKQVINDLIASDKNKLTEADRQWLETMSDAQIAAIASVEPAAAPKENAQQPAEKKVEAPAFDEAKLAEIVTNAVNAASEKTVKAATDAAKAAVTEVLGEGASVLKDSVAQKKAVRNAKIEEILAVNGCAYSKEEVEGMSDVVLDKTLNLMKPEAGYRLSAPHMAANKDNSIPAPPSIVLGGPDKGGK